MPIQIDHIDHIVMTVENVDTTLNWYLRVLGIKSVAFGEGRKALVLNKQRIHLVAKSATIAPCTEHPTPGSLDLCLIASTPLATLLEHLKKERVPIEKGPIKRNGATGLITSIYIRDPERNLLQIANPG